MKNKTIRLILSILLTVSVILPTVCVRAELGIKNEFEVSVLAALDIVPGYPNSYESDKEVDAVSFFDFAYRLIGASVDVNSKLYEAGLGANDTISQWTAVKTVLEIIGYSGMNSDYKKLASEIGLTKGINVSENPLTFDMMVMLFTHALDVRALVKTNVDSTVGDKTIMEYYLKIYETSGIVGANHQTSIDGLGISGADEIRISGKTYSVGKTICDRLLGRNVKLYYYDGGDELTIKWIDILENRNKELIVYGPDVSSTSDNSITYYENNKTRTVSFDSDFVIVYNGKYVDDGSVSIKSVSELPSETTLVDNDGNGKYNMALIMNYQYYYVDFISAEGFAVNDNAAKTSIELDGENLDSILVYKDGKQVELSQIKQGDMLSVAKSVDSSILTVYISSSFITGEITQISTDCIYISSNKYDVSPSYVGDDLKIGRSGTFYFDRMGKIVRCTSLKPELSEYGYLMRITLADDDETYVAEILCANGARMKANFQNSMSYDTKKMNAEAVVASLRSVNGGKQLISYSINNSGNLNRITTADDTFIGIDEKNEGFSMHFMGTGKYRKNNMCFNSKYLMDSVTPIFVVPSSGDVDDFSVAYASELVNNQSYHIQVYDIDEYMYAGCLVVKENMIEPENLRSKRSIVVENVTSVLDDDEEKVCIEGYQQGLKVSYPIDNNNLMDNRGKYYVRDLTAGDVVQVGLSLDKKINAVQVLFKANENSLAIASGTDSQNKYWEGGSSVMPDLYVSFGTIVSRNNAVLLTDDDGIDSKVTKIPHKMGSATTVYIYKDKKLYSANKNDINIWDNVFLQEYQGNLQEVVIVR